MGCWFMNLYERTPLRIPPRVQVCLYFRADQLITSRSCLCIQESDLAVQDSVQCDGDGRCQLPLTERRLRRPFSAKISLLGQDVDQDQTLELLQFILDCSS